MRIQEVEDYKRELTCWLVSRIKDEQDTAIGNLLSDERLAAEKNAIRVHCYKELRKHIDNDGLYDGEATDD